MWDRIKNEDIGMGYGLKYRQSERVYQSVMRWYGHIERMSEEIHVKRIIIIAAGLLCPLNH